MKGGRLEVEGRKLKEGIKEDRRKDVEERRLKEGRKLKDGS